MESINNLFNPPNKYRPMPFWSWNDKLSVNETKRQIDIMEKAGLGGYFMHARGGLLTEFLGKEWFDNINIGISEGEKRNMLPWAYDENGWPSGFGDSKVNAPDEKYWQKYLRCERNGEENGRTVAKVGEYHFYYDVNKFYVDNLDKDVVKEFIKVAYEPYIKKAQGKLCGFFTDEPQLSRNGIPWSNVIKDEYYKEYGEDIIPHLPELFFDTGDFRRTRIKFWRLITILFSTAYLKQIYEFLNKYDMKLTGHLVLEDNLLTQLTTNGAVMPCYEYFHIPGVDALFREPISKMSVYQVSSVAHQLGKKQVLSESFALCGDGISFEELRYLYEFQMVRGANLLCPHLEGYSLRGMRKYDRPPAMYYQQPWWAKYNLFTDMVSTIGMILAEGETDFDTLVLHPQTSAWVCYNTKNDDVVLEISENFANTIDELEKKHILFDLGDEILMEKYACVKNGKLVIGEKEYKCVVLPPYTDMFENTKTLLEEFKNQGGEIVTAEEIRKNDITDNENITYTKRMFDGVCVHYFVNSTNEIQSANFSIKGSRVDFAKKEMVSFDGEYCFNAYDSLVVFEGVSSDIKMDDTKKKVLDINGEWQIEDVSENSLFLDKCDYKIDDGEIHKNQFVSDVQTEALCLEKPCNVQMKFKFDIKDVPSEIYLVTENYDAEILVNGKRVIKEDCGYFVDPSMRKINIASFVRIGENNARIKVYFKQNYKTYENIRKSAFFESERNKLSLDMELSAVYIVGNFEVLTNPEKYEMLERNAVRYVGGFAITKRKKQIALKDIHKNGYPFFAGTMTLSKVFCLEDKEYELSIKKKGINAIEVSVNHNDTGSLMWNPFRMDLSEKLQKGKNLVKIKIYNNLRNLMGPHHLQEGECYKVRPGCYFKKKWLFSADDIIWNDDYCFIEMSIETNNKVEGQK